MNVTISTQEADGVAGVRPAQHASDFGECHFLGSAIID